MKLRFYISLFILICLSITNPVSALEVEWVLVGDPNNTPDDTGFGSVSYDYLISIHEVTNQQYCEFLNSVARDDTYGLYDTEMTSSRFGGIERSGERGDYTYSIKEGREEHPVNFVSWHDCLRYINWLQNGLPEGRQDVNSTEDGSYAFDGPETVGRRNKNAIFFLPSEDEWYKAAYYKSGGPNAGYWRYATQNDNQPVIEKPPGGANSANAGFMPADGLTPVGSYEHSFSAYGTFDQNGNVCEWTETRFNKTQWCLRGGSFDILPTTMKSSVRDRNSVIHRESWNFGFRLAALPED